jgi:hypothetical protein
MGVQCDTYVNWEKDKTRPGASQFRPVVTFFGHDPTPARETLSERQTAAAGRGVAHATQPGCPIGGLLVTEQGALAAVLQLPERR